MTPPPPPASARRRPLREAAALDDIATAVLCETPALDLAWVHIVNNGPGTADHCDELNTPFSDLPICQ